MVPDFPLSFLAKKYHPDALKDEDKEKSKVIFAFKPLVKDLFKEITEAYSILGDPEKRARYDQLIFGDSSRGDFENQEAYEYWKDRKPAASKMRDPNRE